MCEVLLVQRNILKLFFFPNMQVHMQFYVHFVMSWENNAKADVFCLVFCLFPVFIKKLFYFSIFQIHVHTFSENQVILAIIYSIFLFKFKHSALPSVHVSILPSCRTDLCNTVNFGLHDRLFSNCLQLIWQWASSLFWTPWQNPVLALTSRKKE